jgi:hypothetical protein
MPYVTYREQSIWLADNDHYDWLTHDHCEGTGCDLHGMPRPGPRPTQDKNNDGNISASTHSKTVSMQQRVLYSPLYHGRLSHERVDSGHTQEGCT